MAEQVDAAILLETGINNECKIREIEDELKVTKLNFMPEVDNPKYQHNGSGTAILLSKDYDY